MDRKKWKDKIFSKEYIDVAMKGENVKWEGETILKALQSR